MSDNLEKLRTDLAERERALSDATDRATTLAELYQRDRTETNLTRSIVARDVASDAAKAVETARTELRKAERHEKLAELRDGERRLSLHATGTALRPIADRICDLFDQIEREVSKAATYLADRDEERSRFRDLAEDLRERANLPAVDLGAFRQMVGFIRGDAGKLDLSWFAAPVTFPAASTYFVVQEARQLSDRQSAEIVRAMLRGD